MAYVELEDLKQLLETGFAQSEARMRENLTRIIKTEITASEERLRTEMQDGFASVADIITGINDRMDKRFGNHERRIRRLEKRIA